jgi:transposase
MDGCLQESASNDLPDDTTQPSIQDTAAAQAQQRRWQVITLLERGVPIREVAARTSYSSRAVSYIAQRYRASGLAGLTDRRKFGSGATPLLSPQLQHELGLALQHPPPDGDQWTGPRVAEWIATRIGRPVHRQRGWDYLRRLRRDGAGCELS